MKNISIPVLFFISVILQIISCYIFLGENSELNFLLTSGLSSVTATFLAYALVYYFSLDQGEDKRSNSDIKKGFTVLNTLLIITFVLFLFLLADENIYRNNVIAINGIILSIYGRQILNKEIQNFK